jgi:hypothetical protein
VPGPELIVGDREVLESDMVPDFLAPICSRDTCFHFRECSGWPRGTVFCTVWSMLIEIISKFSVAKKIEY